MTPHRSNLYSELSERRRMRAYERTARRETLIYLIAGTAIIGYFLYGAVQNIYQAFTNLGLI